MIKSKRPTRVIDSSKNSLKLSWLKWGSKRGGTSRSRSTFSSERSQDLGKLRRLGQSLGSSLIFQSVKKKSSTSVTLLIIGPRRRVKLLLSSTMNWLHMRNTYKNSEIRVCNLKKFLSISNSLIKLMMSLKKSCKIKKQLKKMIVFYHRFSETQIVSKTWSLLLSRELSKWRNFLKTSKLLFQNALWSQWNSSQPKLIKIIRKVQLLKISCIKDSSQTDLLPKLWSTRTFYSSLTGIWSNTIVVNCKKWLNFWRLCTTRAQR